MCFFYVCVCVCWLCGTWYFVQCFMLCLSVLMLSHQLLCSFRLISVAPVVRLMIGVGEGWRGYQGDRCDWPAHPRTSPLLSLTVFSSVSISCEAPDEGGGRTPRAYRALPRSATRGEVEHRACLLPSPPDLRKVSASPARKKSLAPFENTWAQVLKLKRLILTAPSLG